MRLVVSLRLSERRLRPVGRHRNPSGKALVLFVIALPAILGILGLVYDAGFLLAGARNLQQVADAAAMASAMELHLGKSESAAVARASEYVSTRNGLASAGVTLNHPPQTGPYAGNSRFVEVLLTHPFDTWFVHLVGSSRNQQVAARSVAGYEDSTAGTAIMVLDPRPPQLTLQSLPPLLPGTAALLAGLEIEGLGQVRVDGAVLVNSEWGGVDENGEAAGEGPGPPYGVSCTPVIALTRLLARDLRVVGGVDDEANYRNFTSGKPSPLVANRLPVDDPLISVPVPSVGVDPINVSAQLRGGVSVIQLPLITQTTLQPGVYEWIEVISGNTVFSPGVYVIRNVNPVTRIALNFIGGQITANGVMFYITSSTNFDATTGLPDANDSANPPGGTVTSLTPSALINLAVVGGSLSGINNGGPFQRMLIYQRRLDRRPILIAQTALLGQANLSGTLYSKWGHVTFGSGGTFDLRIVAGSIRLLPLGTLTLAPSVLLPPAQDVFLVE